MSEPSNFKFCHIDRTTLGRDITCVSSPIQTVSGGCNWLLEEYDDIQSLGLGYRHSAAIKTDGTLWLWGNAGYGELGNNLIAYQTSPVQTITTGTNWKQVALGRLHSAAVKTDGTLWLWGGGGSGRLGTNSTANQSSPVQTVTTGTNWKQVSLGNGHSAAIKTDGTLWLWGCGTLGRLGNNSTLEQSSPVQTVSTGTNWKQVSLGCSHSAAIKTDGTLWLWGNDDGGRLGNNFVGDQSSPVQTVSTGTNWKQVDLGDNHSAAVKIDGTLWIWGDNSRGQLGTNSTTTQSSPVQTVTTGTNWKQVSLGCNLVSGAVKTDGTLWLWGFNQFGEIGNNSTICRSSPVQTVSTGTNWKQVALGYFHASSIKTDGTLWLWGAGGCGRLGNNSTTNQSSPVQTVSTNTNWSEECAWLSFSGGLNVSAAIKTDGTLWLWGRRAYGLLGDNSYYGSRHSPAQTVATGNNWKQVALSPKRSAAIKTDGTLWLWGCGYCGRLGINSTISRSSPVQTLSTGNNWKQVALGGEHSAAVKTDGTLWLWGLFTQGRLGDNGTNGFNQSSPIQTISTGNNWKQVSLGSDHSAAIKTDGTLWLWGNNSFSGVLGDNSTTTRSSPVQTVSTGTNWKQVSLGNDHSAAIKTDGTLWLWGRNSYGELGNNSSICRSSPAQTVSTGNNWKQVSLNARHSAAVKTDGTLWLWGRNLCGRLGNNSTIDQSSPVQIVCTGINWKQVNLGYSHSLALTNDNELYGWGDNSYCQLGCVKTTTLSFNCCTLYDFDDVFVRKDIFSEGGLWLWGYGCQGQLGNNSTISQSSPVQTVTNGTNWKQVSLGFFHSAAIKTDGTLWLWGNGVVGRLGNNSTLNQLSPVQTVSTGTNWKQVSSGCLHSAAIKTDGTLWLWGSNNLGRLGNNSTINQSSPVQTVSTGANWKQVSVISHSAAIKTDGTLWLWGIDDSGKLGNNSTINHSSPVQTVSQGNNWKQVSVHRGHSAAIKTDGTLWLWGRGTRGSLGTNSTSDRSSPVQTVTTGTNWKQVALGFYQSAAIKTDGTLWLWGYGDRGQLGNNSTIDQCSPVQTVTTGTNWKQVAHSAAIKTDGTLWLWSIADCGALGNNSTVTRSSPVQTIVQGNNWKQISFGNCISAAIREDCW